MSLRPPLAFNPDTPRRLSTPLLTPFNSTPTFALYGTTLTESRRASAGRMDQACAFGPGRLTLLTFDGETVDVKPLQKVGGDGVHVVVADLGAGKDTVRILDDLQRAYPTPRSDADRELHALLGENNSAVVDAAIVAIESGDAPGLGFVYQMAQRGFDEIAGVACPSQLGERGVAEAARGAAMRKVEARRVRGEGRGVARRRVRAVRVRRRDARGGGARDPERRVRSSGRDDDRDTPEHERVGSQI